MNEDDLKILCESEMEIGSHTITHPNLATLSEARLHEEIKISKLRLEMITQTSLRAFSYPFGKKNTYNDYVKKTVEDAGYASAVMTVFGKVNHRSDIYALPRMGARNSIVRLTNKSYGNKYLTHTPRFENLSDQISKGFFLCIQKLNP